MIFSLEIVVQLFDRMFCLYFNEKDSKLQRKKLHNSKTEMKDTLHDNYRHSPSDITVI
jgi:hypothetical protein